MTESNAPLRLWDYFVDRSAAAHKLASRNKFKLQDLTPHDALTGDQDDIINFCLFCWLDWFYFRNNKKNFPEHTESL